MASISELRERSRIPKELQEQKIQRIQDTVGKVVTSDAMKLTVMNHIGMDIQIDEGKVQKMVMDVTEQVAKVVTDPVLIFEDVCKSRGINRTGMRKVVEKLSRLFDLERDGDYEKKKEAVAIYMSHYEHLYNDLDLLK